MPGMLSHIMFAKEVYRELPICIDKALFMSGNLIPDLPTDKDASHYRKPSLSVPDLLAPDLQEVKSKFLNVENALFLGIYSHLYLDNRFIEGFMISELDWNYEKMRVVNPKNGLEWTASEFFSQDGMYGSYSEINGLMLRDGYVSIDDISDIPETLPLTGVPVFDNNRKSQSWKEEFYGYIRERKPYTGKLFDYDRMCSFIKKTAHEFVEEICVEKTDWYFYRSISLF